MAKFEIPNAIKKPDIRASISLFGRALILLGLILLLFVAYQLWGTNVFENRNQKALRDKFDTKLEKTKKGNLTTDTKPGTSTTTPGGDPSIEPTPEQIELIKQEVVRGAPIAIIKIPKIGLDHVVVSGTDRTSLQKGPGHYPTTPLPGQFGNSAIAGHRTTYGSPFARLDELAVGDKIILETVRGNFTYEVSKPNVIVKPNDVSVIAPTPDPSDPTGKTLLAELTLTTCHPKFSAAQRLITRAKLVNTEDATVARQLLDKDGNFPSVIDIGEGDSPLNADGFGNNNILLAMAGSSFQLPILWWLLLLVTVGSTWWYFYRKYRNWKVWVAGVLPFAVVLLIYFINLENVLPQSI